MVNMNQDIGTDICTYSSEEREYTRPIHLLPVILSKLQSVLMQEGRLVRDRLNEAIRSKDTLMPEKTVISGLFVYCDPITSKPVDGSVKAGNRRNIGYLAHLFSEKKDGVDIVDYLKGSPIDIVVHKCNNSGDKDRRYLKLEGNLGSILVHEDSFTIKTFKGDNFVINPSKIYETIEDLN